MNPGKAVAVAFMTGIAGMCFSQQSQGIQTFRESPEILVNVNGKAVEQDRAEAQMKNGRVMVPLRGVLDQLRVAIDWYPQQKVVVARKEDHTLTLGIGDGYGTVDGKLVSLDQPATIRNGRTMVPLRYVAEALGAYVMWDQATRTVVITTQADSPVGPDSNPPPSEAGGGSKLL